MVAMGYLLILVSNVSPETVGVSSREATFKSWRQTKMITVTLNVKDRSKSTLTQLLATNKSCACTKTNTLMNMIYSSRHMDSQCKRGLKGTAL